MPDTTLTTLEYALLGLLDATPMSGYDVSRIFAQTPMAHFSSSPGAIYPALKRLERRSIVTAKLDFTTEARPRRVYALAAEGREALDAWLHKRVTREELVRDGRAPILRFSMMEGHLTDEEVRDYLASYQQAISGYLDELSVYRQQADGGGLHSRLAMEHGIAAYRCQAAWIAEALLELERIRPVADV